MKIATRKAFLIGCPGPKSNYLRGVRADLITFKNYLLSKRGGEWYTDEVTIINDPNPVRLLMLLSQVEADYVLIYFSGHGFTEKDTGARRLCCSGGTIIDESLIAGRAKRVLLINDVCRTFVGASIGRIESDDPEYFNFTGPEDFRLLFDQAIHASPYTKIIVHGVQPGLPASDTTSGGAFTQGLLYTGNHMTVKGDARVVTIGDVLRFVPKVLSERGNSQMPQLYYYGNDFKLPFAIAIPAALKLSEPARYVEKPEHNESGKVLLGLGLLVLGVILAKG